MLRLVTGMTSTVMGIWDFGCDGDQDVNQANVDTMDQDLEAIQESDNNADLW